MPPGARSTAKESMLRKLGPIRAVRACCRLLEADRSRNRNSQTGGGEILRPFFFTVDLIKVVPPCSRRCWIPVKQASPVVGIGLHFQT